jgi:hypothetical protein
MQYALPLLRRFFAKVVLNVLPAAMASVIGGILFTHYQLGGATAPQTGAEQLAPASAEMMKLVRDEHVLIVDFLKAQLAAEKSRLAEEEKAAHAADEGKPAQPAPTAAAARHVTVAMASGKTAAARSRPVAAVAPHAPLVIAQTGQIDPAEAPARDPDSFLAKTIDLKDHVVAATQRVVTTIGSIPSWIGERIGGSTVSSPPAGRLASASW